jgi:hypothetical protein
MRAMAPLRAHQTRTPATARFAEGVRAPVMTFAVRTQVTSTGRVPSALSLSPRRSRTIERPLRLGFAKGAMAHQRPRVRNGQLSDRGCARARELWLFRNYHTSMPHAMPPARFPDARPRARKPRPIIAALAVDDRGRLPTDLGRKDTVLVWPGETVRAVVDFAHPWREPGLPGTLPQPRARGRRDDAWRARSVTARTILLAGGGHSHVEVLRRFGASLQNGVSLVLVSPDRYTPYSGMLPGLVAGHYTHDEAHIDLEPLARYARAEFGRDRIAALDPVGNVATTESGRRVPFDFASLDIGSLPDMSMPGAREHAIGVKPVDRFVAGWRALRDRARHGRLARLAIVGGGAGGVEVTLAIHHPLRMDDGAMPALALVTVKQNLPTAAQRTLFRKLDDAGVAAPGQRAASFDAEGVALENGDRVAADAIVRDAGHASPMARGIGPRQ